MTSLSPALSVSLSLSLYGDILPALKPDDHPEKKIRPDKNSIKSWNMSHCH